MKWQKGSVHTSTHVLLAQHRQWYYKKTTNLGFHPHVIGLGFAYCSLHQGKQVTIMPQDIFCCIDNLTDCWTVPTIWWNSWNYLHCRKTHSKFVITRNYSHLLKVWIRILSWLKAGTENVFRQLNTKDGALQMPCDSWDVMYNLCRSMLLSETIDHLVK